MQEYLEGVNWKTRILAFDIASERAVAEYAYQLDAFATFDPSLPKPDKMKLSSIVALNATTLMVNERTNHVAKLYAVDITRATNILGSKWGDLATTPSLEALVDPAGATAAGASASAWLSPQRSKHRGPRVVLTDGEDNRSSRSAEELVRELQQDQEGRSIKVFTIAYSSGADASADALKQIAQATGASSYQSTVTAIDQVYRDIATFF